MIKKANISFFAAVAAVSALSVSSAKAVYDYWDLNVGLAGNKYVSGLNLVTPGGPLNGVIAGLFVATPTGADAITPYNDNIAGHARNDGYVSPDLGIMPTGTSSFYTFCTDVNAYLASGDFDPTPFAGQNGVSPNWTPGGIQNAAWLYNTYWLGTFAGNPNNISAIQAAALQVAIWESLYDSTLSLVGGSFQMSGNAGVSAQAGIYLAGLSAALSGGGFAEYTTTWLQPMSTSTGQERINQGLIYNPIPGSLLPPEEGSVPDGGLTLLLLGLSMGGLAMFGRLPGKA